MVSVVCSGGNAAAVVAGGGSFSSVACDGDGTGGVWFNASESPGGLKSSMPHPST